MDSSAAFAEWTCPLPDGGTAPEIALTYDRQRSVRLLIVPALFDEANKLRRLTVEVMRRLDGAAIDSFLPDLPGCGESLQPLEAQTPQTWRDAMAACARHFAATHVLAMRGGALLTPTDLPGWRYAAVGGAQTLRRLIRSRIVASREQGRAETPENLMKVASTIGIELAGYRLGPDFVFLFQALEEPSQSRLSDVDQELTGGSGLWLRAEPGEDRAQADALAAIVAVGIAS